MEPLTQRQQEILDFIAGTHTRSGVMPSTREIQEHFRFASQTAAMNHVRALEKKGAIQRLAGKARAMALTSELRRETIVDIPIFGQIAAGMPQLTDEEAEEGRISVDAESVGIPPGKKVFALRVRGDSMIGAGINDGDLAILELRPPRDRDIVAALIDGETTLKRFVLAQGRPHLHAENPDYPDLIPAQELLVQGVMSALIRKYRR